MSTEVTQDLTWDEVEKLKPEELLTESELKKYNEIVADFTERVKNTKKKVIKEIAEGAIGLYAWRYARSVADPHKESLLYKKVYQLVFYYNYPVDNSKTIQKPQ